MTVARLYKFPVFPYFLRHPVAKQSADFPALTPWHIPSDRIIEQKVGAKGAMDQGGGFGKRVSYFVQFSCLFYMQNNWTDGSTQVCCLLFIIGNFSYSCSTQQLDWQRNNGWKWGGLGQSPLFRVIFAKWGGHQNKWGGPAYSGFHVTRTLAVHDFVRVRHFEASGDPVVGVSTLYVYFYVVVINRALNCRRTSCRYSRLIDVQLCCVNLSKSSVV